MSCMNYYEEKLRSWTHCSLYLSNKNVKSNYYFNQYSIFGFSSVLPVCELHPAHFVQYYIQRKISQNKLKQYNICPVDECNSSIRQYAQYRKVDTLPGSTSPIPVLQRKMEQRAGALAKASSGTSPRGLFCRYNILRDVDEKMGNSCRRCHHKHYLYCRFQEFSS